jgi:hypothetical protein
MTVCGTQNYAVSGLCPSSEIVKYKKTQLFGNWVCFSPKDRGGRHLQAVTNSFPQLLHSNSSRPHPSNGHWPPQWVYHQLRVPQGCFPSTNLNGSSSVDTWFETWSGIRLGNTRFVISAQVCCAGSLLSSLLCRKSRLFRFLYYQKFDFKVQWIFLAQIGRKWSHGVMNC